VAELVAERWVMAGGKEQARDGMVGVVQEQIWYVSMSLIHFPDFDLYL